jgi:hypothetical protein
MPIDILGVVGFTGSWVGDFIVTGASQGGEQQKTNDHGSESSHAQLLFPKKSPTANLKSPDQKGRVISDPAHAVEPVFATG